MFNGKVAKKDNPHVVFPLIGHFGELADKLSNVGVGWLADYNMSSTFIKCMIGAKKSKDSKFVKFLIIQFVILGVFRRYSFGVK